MDIGRRYWEGLSPFLNDQVLNNMGVHLGLMRALHSQLPQISKSPLHTPNPGIRVGIEEYIIGNGSAPS